MMVTTSVRMVHGLHSAHTQFIRGGSEVGIMSETYVHGNTTNNGPAVALGLELVVGTTGLEQGLVDTTTSSNDANNSTVGAWDDLRAGMSQMSNTE